MRFMAGLLLVGLAGCGDGEPPPVPATAVASTPQPVTDAPPSAALPSVQPPPAAARVVMEVMQLAGRSEADVSALLGPPETCADIHRARLCRYPPRDDEVMFVRGKADMITVQGMGAVAFDQDALAALGLAPAEPDHSDEHAIRWEAIPGLHEVTVFPGPGHRVHYAYVKVGAH